MNMSIQNNIIAMNAERMVGITSGKKSKSTEKLSSGYRINRAADDAAGLAISEKMRRQIRGLDRASDNILAGVGYVQTAEGALNEVDEMLHRMTELAVQAANDTNTDQDREYIDMEFQQIKGEMSRIFDTTSFNEQLIWEPDPDKLVQVGTEQQSTITFRPTAITTDTSYANKGVLPYQNIKLVADAEGIKATWTGYNGNSYQTNKADWESLKENNYSFNMENYMPDSIKDGNGNPPFTYSVWFEPNQYATQDEIIAAINQSSIGTSASSSAGMRFEDAAGNASSLPSGVSVSSSVSLSYAAAYTSAVSGSHDVDAPDDAFIEPSPAKNLVSFPVATTVEAARNSSESWTFKFNMSGIGGVTASCTGISYYSNDMADDDEGYWWGWHDAWLDNHTRYEPHYYKGYIERSVGNTLGGVMDALTGSKGSGTPGLLSTANGGDSDNGGYITMSFQANADSAFSSGSVSGQNGLFNFNVKIRVDSSDTEESVLGKITSALNANTRLDLFSQSPSGDESLRIYSPSSSHKIETPVYDYDHYRKHIPIQAGVEAGQILDINYPILNLNSLGLAQSNTWSQENAATAIEEVKEALATVNGERAELGAWQNRLEHAYNINKNTAENTQYAESQIRDTDMAKEMVEYSNQNIMEQAGMSMLSQANQQRQGILSLLQ